MNWSTTYSGEPEVILTGLDWSTFSGSEYICTGTVTLDLPDPPGRDEFINAETRRLRAQQGEYQHKIDLLEERIKQLLCIENKSTSS